MNLALLYSRIREDEKLLLTELGARGHGVTEVDVREPAFSIDDEPGAMADVDLALNRCVESRRVRYVAELVDHYDVPVVNSPRTSRICADEVRGSVVLAEGGVPTPWVADCSAST